MHYIYCCFGLIFLSLVSAVSRSPVNPAGRVTRANLSPAIRALAADVGPELRGITLLPMNTSDQRRTSSHDSFKPVQLLSDKFSIVAAAKKVVKNIVEKSTEFLQFLQSNHDFLESRRISSSAGSVHLWSDLTAFAPDSAGKLIGLETARTPRQSQDQRRVVANALLENTYFFNKGFTSQQSNDHRVGYLRVGCTGALVSDHVVMTAAHCVYDTVNNKWQSWSNMEFAPGYQSGSAPNGWMHPISAIIFTAYVDQSKWSEWNDFALIAYEAADAKNVGYFGFAYNSGECGNELTNEGYPQNKAGKQWMDKCKAKVCNTGTLLTHDCDINPGSSGGPLWMNGMVVAVQSGHCGDGSCDNTAYNLNQYSFNLALSWRNKYH